MFKPIKIYYEENVSDYTLGKQLLHEFNDVPKKIINNHNNIEELRKKSNKEFVEMKKYLILGIRKTQKFIPNYKVSDYLVPYTSSGCSAMCLYCYLMCHYNKCSYLRIFVNREELLDKIINFSQKQKEEKVYEIGSNSDLVLENTITRNLEWTINEFAKRGKGFLTFPTKFSYIDPLLTLNHKRKIIIRMSVNPEYIISHVEFKTSRLNERIEAINRLVEADYIVGILIAPVIFIDGWQSLYEDLIIKLSQGLNEKAKSNVFFEIIFMTYSYVHSKINEEAFPNIIEIYKKEQMTGRGMGKYAYKNEIKQDGEKFFKKQLSKHFKNNKIIYIV